MFRKFLAAVILAVFMLNAQIAFAADVDWNSVPKISSKAQLARYIENGRRRGQTEFNFILTYIKVNNQKELNKLADEFAGSIAPAPKANLITAFGTGRFTYKINTEYPGIHVANAYISRNQHQAWMNLTNEEQKLYNIAVGIVDEANKRSSEIEKARYIHDEICRRIIKYESHTNENAVGALIIGVTNCQGFTDAFYMLGRMAGLNVGRIHGNINNGKTPHGWNYITLSDGKTYFVDVTNGFNTKTQYLFLATRERMEKSGWWCEWSIIPNLQ